jgi:hypothetical protein
MGSMKFSEAEMQGLESVLSGEPFDVAARRVRLTEWVLRDRHTRLLRRLRFHLGDLCTGKPSAHILLEGLQRVRKDQEADERVMRRVWGASHAQTSIEDTGEWWFSEDQLLAIESVILGESFSDVQRRLPINSERVTAMYRSLLKYLQSPLRTGKAMPFRRVPDRLDSETRDLLLDGVKRYRREIRAKMRFSRFIWEPMVTRLTATISPASCCDTGSVRPGDGPVIR